MLAVCFDVIKCKHAYCLEEELSTAEVVLYCAAEHLLLDHYLLFEVVNVGFL